MEYKKKQKKLKAFKIIFIILIPIVIILIGIRIINKNTSVDLKDIDSTIIGTFSYGNDIKYKFDKNGKGAMYLGKEEFIYTYKTENNKIIINFKNEQVQDATYSYQIESDTLKLIGEKGTAGGEYILSRNK